MKKVKVVVVEFNPPRSFQTPTCGGKRYVQCKPVSVPLPPLPPTRLPAQWPNKVTPSLPEDYEQEIKDMVRRPHKYGLTDT